MLGELVKAVLERALDAELTAHLGYERREVAGRNSGNSRNGRIAKKVQTGIGPVALDVPRDRAGSFEPVQSARITRGPQPTRFFPAPISRPPPRSDYSGGIGW
jgi:transposase-like protein